MPLAARFAGSCACGAGFPAGALIDWSAAARKASRCPACRPATAAPAGPEARCRILIRRIVWSSPDSARRIVRAEFDGTAPADAPVGGEFAAAGPLGPVSVGDRIEIVGRWARDAKWGWQLAVSAAVGAAAATDEGMIALLSRLPNVGRARAEAILRALGGRAATLEALDIDPGRLAAADGITPERAREIAEAWREESALREALLGLGTLGLPEWMLAKAIDAWGADAAQIVTADPYTLMELRVAFRRADEVAGRVGIDPADPRRLAAATAHVLDLAGENGDCWHPEASLTGEAGDPRDRVATEVRALGLTPETVRAGLELLAQPRTVTRRDGTVRDLPPRVVRDADRIWDARLLHAEEEVARHLARLQAATVLALDVPEAVVAGLDDPDKIEAVRAAATSGVLVVTGGPGTGKTTLVKTLLDLLDTSGPIMLCAPTGKAAIRMREQTGREARTIHRTLGYDPGTGGWKHGEDEPLEAGVVVVDESSMVDVELAAALLAAIPTGARLLVVGDVDQLPSVGPGSVLRDVIDSGTVPVCRLTRIFRQASESRIPYVARDLNEGAVPDVAALSGPSSDVVFVETAEASDVRETIVALVAGGIEQKRGIPSAAIQVLSPQRKTEIGVRALNGALQAALRGTADAPTVRIGVGDDSAEARVGDRVIHIKNDYELGVFNGEIGTVLGVAGRDERGKAMPISPEILRSISASEDAEPVPPKNVALVVDYGDRRVGYARAGLEELQLAYAITVHKSQGSQFAAVVVPVHAAHSYMLTRALVYTAITRAEKLLVLVGTRDALARAARTVRGSDRRTGLRDRLAGALDAARRSEAARLETRREEERILSTPTILDYQSDAEELDALRAPAPAAPLYVTPLQATNCCACGRDLVDAESVERGYGPICAERLGLSDAAGEPDWTRAEAALAADDDALGRLREAHPDAHRAAGRLVWVVSARYGARGGQGAAAILAAIEALGYTGTAAVVRDRIRGRRRAG